MWYTVSWCRRCRIHRYVAAPLYERWWFPQFLTVFLWRTFKIKFRKPTRNVHWEKIDQWQRRYAGAEIWCDFWKKSLELVSVFKETSRYFIFLLREAGLKCTTICACTENTDFILRGLFKKYPPVDPFPLLKGLAARCHTLWFFYTTRIYTSSSGVPSQAKIRTQVCFTAIRRAKI